LRRSFRDQAPEVEDGHPGRQPEHHFNVVLDQQERCAALGDDLLEHDGEPLRFLGVQARRRLVEHHHVWLGRQRPADLDQPAHPEREVRHRRVRDAV
jgi:hypothetical protein